MDKKCAIVTGANGSMGLALSKGLVDAGFHVIMACRDINKGINASKSVSIENDVTVLQLNLGSFHSINNFVENVTEKFSEIDVIVNNAGVISRNYRLTDEGYENTVAVNFVGTALLTEKILPLMPQGAIIVNTVSLVAPFGHISRKLLRGNERHFNRMQTYANSKLALLLFTRRFAEENKHMHVYAVDPGVVSTNMITMGNWLDPIADKIFRPLIKTPEKGAATALGLATGRIGGKDVLWRGEKPWKTRCGIKATKLQQELYDFIQTLA